MTVEDVRERVKTIALLAPGDPEAAHSKEDALYRDVLRAIAEGRGSQPSLLAAAALEAAKIEFPRWCA